MLDSDGILMATQENRVFMGTFSVGIESMVTECSRTPAQALAHI